MKGNTLVQLY